MTITPKPLTDSLIGVDVPFTGIVYDGTAKTPDASYSDTLPAVLTANDFDTAFENNVNAGEATVTYTGKNNYSGTVVDHFDIEKAQGWDPNGEEPGPGDVPQGGKSKFDVTSEYDGMPHTINTNALMSVTKDDFTLSFEYALTKDGAYQSSPFTFTDVVTTSFWYKICLNNANYDDYVHEAQLTITARDIANVTIASIADQTATGAEIKPVPAVTDGDPSIVKASDYEVSYSDNINPGTATLTLTGKGNYTGTKTTTFKIVSGGDAYAIFDAFGGSIEGEAMVSQKVSTVYGTLPTATREGYVLDGWYLGVTNNAPKAADNGAVLAAGDHTLFARWSYDPSVTPDPDTIYKWEAIDGDTARILGFKNASQQLATMAIPDKIHGLFVTEIGTAAFANSTCGATKLMLPMFCTKIGDKAFLNIPTITSITFADSRDWQDPANTALLSIGRYAFSGAKGLTTLSLGDSVGSIGDYAFLNTRNLTSVTILGKPTVGTQVFRSAGVDTTGVTIHLDPALASDSAYMSSLKANMYNVTVKTDAVVKSLKLAKLSLIAQKLTLTVVPEVVKAWSGVNPDALRVNYRADLGDEPTVLVPTAATANGDGSVTLEVEAPQGASGFFQTVLEK